MKKEEIKDLLIYSLDNKLTSKEQNTLVSGLLQFPELEKEKKSFLELRTLIANQKVEASPKFVDQLMMQIEENETKRNSSFESTMVFLFPKIAAACVFIVAATLLSTYLGEGSISSEALIGIIDLSPEEAYGVLVEEN